MILQVDAFELNSMLNQVLSVATAADLGRWWLSPKGEAYQVGADHCEWVMDNPTAWQDEPYADRVKAKVKEYSTWRDYSACGEITTFMMQAGWVRVFDDALSTSPKGEQHLRSFLQEKRDQEVVTNRDHVVISIGKDTFEGPVAKFLAQ